MGRKKSIHSQYTAEVAKILSDFAKKKFDDSQIEFSRYLTETLQSSETMPIATSLSLLAKMNAKELIRFISEIKIDAFIPNQTHHFNYYLSEIVRNIWQSETGKKTNIKGQRRSGVTFQRKIAEKYGFTQSLVSSFLRKKANIETEKLLDIFNIADSQQADEFKFLISKHFAL